MQTVIVSATTLFEVAQQYLDDPTQWDRIAALNGTSDPWIDGLTALKIPSADGGAGGRG